MINLRSLLNSLNNGLVEIKFSSMNTGDQKSILCSLNEQYLKSHSTMNQDSNNDSILVYKPQTKDWEDIRLDSILDWAEITNE